MCVYTFNAPTNVHNVVDFKEAAKDTGCLAGVIACVAKCLSERQVELNNLIKQLGGDFRWNFDATVRIVRLLLTFSYMG